MNPFSARIEGLRVRLLNYTYSLFLYYLNRILISDSAFLPRVGIKGDLQILYKSRHFLALNKPCDLIINSDDPNRDSLYVRLAQTFPDLVDPTLRHGFHVLHRLDFATSGVIIVPLHKRAAGQARKTMDKRLCRKFYHAILRGHVSYDFVVVDLPVGNDVRPDWNGLRMATSLSPYCGENRKAAVTKLIVLSRGTSSDGHPATEVAVELITGRRHQIRVHCHDIGHSVLGDYTYSYRRDIFTPRMFLHSRRLILPTEIEDLDIDSGNSFENIKDYESHCRYREMDTLLFDLFRDESLPWKVIN